MKFTLKIDSNNAAFEGEYERVEEVARLLAKAATQVRGGLMAAPLIDVNGNTVGQWTMTFTARRRS